MTPAPRGLWLSTSHFCSSPWGRAQTSKANAHRPPRPGSTGSGRPVLCGCGRRVPLAGPWAACGRTGGVLRTRAGAHPLSRHRCCLYPSLPGFLLAVPPPPGQYPQPWPSWLQESSLCRPCPLPAFVCGLGSSASLRQGPRWLLLQLRAPLLVVLRSGVALCGASVPRANPLSGSGSPQCPSPT